MYNLEKNLKYLRRRSGLSQEQLAEALNIGRRVVSYHENGEHQPELRLLADITEYYKVTLDELIRGNLELKDNQDGLRRFCNDNTEKDFNSLIENSYVWKEYLKRKGEPSVFSDECDEWIKSVPNEYGDISDFIEDIVKEKHKEKAEAEASSGDYHTAQNELESLLFEGWLGAFEPLLKNSIVLFDRDSHQGFDTELLALKTYLEFVKKIVVYGAISYREIVDTLECLSREDDI